MAPPLYTGSDGRQLLVCRTRRLKIQTTEPLAANETPAPLWPHGDKRVRDGETKTNQRVKSSTCGSIQSREERTEAWGGVRYLLYQDLVVLSGEGDDAALR